jgi:hypothetical protein
MDAFFDHAARFFFVARSTISPRTVSSSLAEGTIGPPIEPMPALITLGVNSWSPPWSAWL